MGVRAEQGDSVPCWGPPQPLRLLVTVAARLLPSRHRAHKPRQPWKLGHCCPVSYKEGTVVPWATPLAAVWPVLIEPLAPHPWPALALKTQRRTALGQDRRDWWQLMPGWGRQPSSVSSPRHCLPGCHHPGGRGSTWCWGPSLGDQRPHHPLCLPGPLPRCQAARGDGFPLSIWWVLLKP